MSTPAIIPRSKSWKGPIIYSFGRYKSFSIHLNILDLTLIKDYFLGFHGIISLFMDLLWFLFLKKRKNLIIANYS